jgi:putative chitinase
MSTIDRASFLAGYLKAFGAPANSQLDGLNFLIDKIEADDQNWASIQQVSYGLATFKWETGHTFEPVTERGPKSYFDKYDAGTPIGKRLGNTQPGDGFRYRGRGYVQLTGRANYARDGQLLEIDLVNDPDKALDAEVAYQIAARGMHGGWFTGVKLGRYLAAGTKPDYVNARRIINGLDHAQDIAAFASTFEDILKACAPDT